MNYKSSLKLPVSEKIFQVFNYSLLIGFAILCLYPMYYVFIYSISVPHEAAKGNIYFLPRGLTFMSYMTLFKLNYLINSAFISLSRTILGTIITVLCSSYFAFLLTNKNLPFRKIIYRLALITMYFNVGLIPWYITMVKLGFKNNFLLYVVPSAVGVFYVILIKTYMEQLPASLAESAEIDGAGKFKVFSRIIFPLCTPIVVTVAIFTAVGQWNSWQDNLYLCTLPELKTLQLLLLEFLMDQTSIFMADNVNNLSSLDLSKIKVTPTSIQRAITILVTFPILLVYPFFQRYFVGGIMIGAIKE